MAIEIVKPHLLIVEGVDDANFFNALIMHLNITNIQVLPIGGKTKTRDKLNALANTPGFSNVVSLIIARDADEAPNGAFQSVQDSLKATGLPVPEKPFAFCDGEPNVMVMILPQQGKTGALEDLCLESIEEDAVYYCVKQHFQCLTDQGVPLPKQIGKAMVQVFLGSKEQPGKSLGVAAQSGYWPMGSNAFAQLRECLSDIGK